MHRKRNRREFLKGAAAASLLAAQLEAGDTPAQERDPRAATADGLSAAARARFGRHMSEEQVKNVQRGISQTISGAETIKRWRLENSDEPDFVFFAEGP